MNYYNIIIPRPVNKLFTYTSEIQLVKGTRVIVDFRNRKTAGVVFSKSDIIDQKCKSINCILDKEEPFFNEKYLELLKRLSRNYVSSYGEVLDTLINRNLLKADYNDKESVKFNKVSIKYDSNEKLDSSTSKLLSLIGRDNRPILFRTDNIYKRISAYVGLIKKFNLQDRQVKILCPDIATLNKIVRILSPVFKDKIGVYFAAKTLKYRKKMLLGYRNGDVEIIAGTKSVLGLPSKNEDLIIVEGEEDEFYKQEESPYMQYRDAAIEYARIFKIPIVLGSSIPSLESFYNAKNNIYKYLYLENDKNIKNAKVNLINIKEHESISGLISMPIYEKIYKNIKEKKKTLLLINKKGYSNYLVCNNCGSNLMCDRCSVNATYYRSKGYCLCNYCGKKIDIVCSKCGSKDFFDFGFG
ncbi:MAG: hypothetical protein SVN78_04465, partial [Deferribacterota bacterium]|nr:hypothetical protein [Deferribacterota bacterium]